MIEPFKILSKPTGFSLIEMMVVVAIMGVLTTIAIPNYNMMTEKAHQSEAKAELAAMYAVEKAYFGEFRNYTLCLFDIGYQPDNQRRLYFFGFLNNPNGCGTGGKLCLYDNTATQCSFDRVAWKGGFRNTASFEMNLWANPGLTGAGVPNPYTVDMAGSTFKVVAFGSIGNRSKIFDIWSIDDQKNQINEQPGL